MTEISTITGPEGPIPYSPDWLNALSEADRQSLPVRNFSRGLHNDGGAHVAWLLWSVQERDRPTPLEGANGMFLTAGHEANISPQGELSAAKQPEVPSSAPAEPNAADR